MKMLRTNCLKGHPLTNDNVEIIAGRRNCRICTDARELRYREAHPEVQREITNRWRKNNREKYLSIARMARHIRRIRAIAQVGSWTLEQWATLKDAFGNRCLACGLSELGLKRLGRLISPDHVRPLAKGGTNDLSNIQPLCHGKGGCNNRKHTRWVDYRGGFPVEIV